MKTIKITRFIKLFDKGLAVKAVLCATVFAMILNICGVNAECEEIKKNVLRLHIIANSDEPHDQALKLKVRDRLLEQSESVFADCISEKEAEESAVLSLDLFQKTAESVIAENGYEYEVRVELGNVWFERRDYDGFSLPAGEYEALRVIIGDGKGKNWWCVMFPSVCLPAARTQSSFDDVLENDSVEIVQQPKKYKARLKIVEIFNKTKRFLSKLL